MTLVCFVLILCRSLRKLLAGAIVFGSSLRSQELCWPNPFPAGITDETQTAAGKQCRNDRMKASAGGIGGRETKRWKIGLL